MNLDKIIILSLHEQEMRKQFIDLGVEEDKIVGYAFLREHRYLVKQEMPVSIILKGADISKLITKAELSKSILIMSHSLDFSGASLALYYATKVLISHNYKIVFAAWNDGPLKDMLYSNGIPVIIEPNLEMCTANELAWISNFDKIICNTLNYYYFLSDRKKDGKFIWWLHDPELFYETLDKKVFSRIKRENLKVCAAGKIAEQAIKHYIPDVEISQLLYGIPDTRENNNMQCYSEKLRTVVIANVQNYKGQDILIGAVKKIPYEDRKFLSVKIVGNTESAYASNLKIQAETLGDVVEFTGKVDRKEIENIFKETDLLICPSRVDTMSVSCGEAIQRGIPCLVSSSIGMAEFIEDGVNGFVFKNEDLDELSSKLKWCINNKKFLVSAGQKSRKIYDEYFSMCVFEKRLLEIITKFF